MYLAHIGSFVPAERAKVGIIDGLFTRIQTRESVSVSQSAFLIDVNQVNFVAYECDCASCTCKLNSKIVEITCSFNDFS